ncbi:D-glycero-alpha-D-manno-heptose-1,7-bisphosphate 7-phosphatase [Flavihumibacter petaseus]|uniref:D,D-heptose 1,7-bisphosphate phosphatase n=1 Tax=Flavihumibacter petaseus NBRC 106054 TaxID=1220578 RepID=A0A0E9N655_9BACT|nr:HAD-IIIA family hydrolase [Flavihumibacter petaseus]GAO45309.1 putative phosphatase [Flavihumibacter petaseus NBRC 106054]
MLNLAEIRRDWTLFLDRDGVINIEKEADYIYHPGEFVLYDGVLDALEILKTRFGRIVMVTNQRGIAKGLMTEKDLHDIHDHMLELFSSRGVVIDEIYFNSSLDDEHPDRKPQPGMAYKAKAAFPQIWFEKSVMVGNNLSDMLFGRNAGMHTVFLLTTSPDQPLPHPAIDLAFNDLLNFAQAIPAV